MRYSISLEFVGIGQSPKNERINWTSPTLIFLTNTFSANFRPALPVKAQHTIVRSPISLYFWGLAAELPNQFLRLLQRVEEKALLLG